MGSLVCLALLIIGAVIFFYFSAPTEKSQIALDNLLTVQANEYGYKEFGFFSDKDTIASFNVSNGTVKSCEPLTGALFLKWQEGQYEPNWAEKDHENYKLIKEYIPPGLIGPVYVRYFLFFNEDSYDKEVHLQVTQFWSEQNSLNLVIGVATIVAGLGLQTALIAIYKRKPFVGRC
ncbi:MAG TPA: hypothetical protein VIH48_03105 [Candidatus Bathyarchaeia archaeon]